MARRSQPEVERHCRYALWALGLRLKHCLAALPADWSAAPAQDLVTVRDLVATADWLLGQVQAARGRALLEKEGQD